MKKMNKLLWCMVMGGALMFSSCTTTQVTAVWKDDTYGGHPHKVLVIAVLQNSAVRRIMETALVRQLNARGIEAVPGFSVLSDDQEISKDVIAGKARELGIDTVLVSELLDKRTVASYVPGQASYGFGTAYYVAPYYGGWYNYAYSPGYYVQDQYVILVTNLYDVKTEKLVWSATSETKITGGDEQTVRSFSQTILNEMARQNLFPAVPSSSTAK